MSVPWYGLVAGNDSVFERNRFRTEAANEDASAATGRRVVADRAGDQRGRARARIIEPATVAYRHVRVGVGGTIIAGAIIGNRTLGQCHPAVVENAAARIREAFRNGVARDRAFGQCHDRRVIRKTVRHSATTSVGVIPRDRAVGDRGGSLVVQSATVKGPVAGERAAAELSMRLAIPDASARTADAIIVKGGVPADRAASQGGGAQVVQSAPFRKLSLESIWRLWLP